MADHNQQGRRPHYHRGRRGSDRRGPDRRSAASAPQDQGGRDQQDVEQIMREIRSRIAQRHGIELTTQQIQELAARRLEAILDPRTVNPSLLEQLRRSAAKAPEWTTADTPPSYEFEDRTIYESHNGLLRFIRRLLNPILKLFFNPNPIAHALNAQSRLNAALSARQGERDRRQAEWNALHYDILQRLVTETARVSVEMQSLASRVESLNGRVDFNDRRVRIIEAAPPPRPQQRPSEGRPAATAAPAAAPEEIAPAEARTEGSAAAEGNRRRRRRRRGRRSGAVAGEPAPPSAGSQATEAEAEGNEAGDFDETGDEDIAAATESAAPAETESQQPSGDFEETRTAEEPPETSVTAPQATSAPVPTAAAAPAPFPTDEEGVATTPPSLPRDEPGPPPADTATDKEPVDR